MSNFNQEEERIVNWVRLVAFYIVTGLTTIWLIMVYISTLEPAMANGLLLGTLVTLVITNTVLWEFTPKNKSFDFCGKAFFSLSLITIIIVIIIGLVSVFLVANLFFDFDGNIELELSVANVALITLFVLCASVWQTPFTHKGIIFHVLGGLFLGVLFGVTFTIFSESIVFTKHGAHYVQEKRFPTSPFELVRPTIEAPPLEGTFLIKEVPKDWSVMVAYRISNPEKLAEDARPLLTLLTMLENGVIIPDVLYDTESSDNPEVKIREYLEESFPFLETCIRVGYTKYWETQ